MSDGSASLSSWSVVIPEKKDNGEREMERGREREGGGRRKPII